MNLKTNIPEEIERLEKIKTAVGGNSGGVPIIPDFSDALLSALNAGMGKLKFRIFNKGLDANEGTLGGYVGNKTKITSRRSRIKKYGDLELNKERKNVRKNLKGFIGEDGYTEYEKKRLAHGRQIFYKDLEFDGSLRRSIETVKQDNKEAVMAIVNEETAAISEYQEQQIGKIRGTGLAAIFEPSQSEFDFMQQEANAAIQQVIEKLLNQ